MVTSRDVARAAGVSQSTVSRVLRDGTVAPATRKRIEKAFRDLGYVRNASAVAMRTSKSGAIGVVASEMSNPYVPRLLDAVSSRARELNLSVMLWNDDDPAARMAQEAVAAGVVDGVMFTAARNDTTGPEILSKRGIPVVLVNRAADETSFDQVTSDHHFSGWDAADYFLAHGRRRLAVIAGPRDTFASPARERGFRQRLVEEGVSVPDRSWITGQTSYEHGWDAAKALMSSGHALPDAIFCTADFIAIGAIAALRHGGIRVPEDVWVMGNDGLPMSEWSVFDLTTHLQPITQIVRLGLDRLAARIGGVEEGPVRITLSTELLVRGSTAHAPVHDRAQTVTTPT